MHLLLLCALIGGAVCSPKKAKDFAFASPKKDFAFADAGSVQSSVVEAGEIEVDELLANEMTEGDMRGIGGGDNRVVLKNTGRWKDGVVPYTKVRGFDDDPKRTQSLNEAIAAFQRQTCIRFQPRGGESDYVEFDHLHADGGCWSYVGKTGGKQTVSLHHVGPDGKPPGCTGMGIYAHEMIHALGFVHEHQRPDRKSYVSVFEKDTTDPSQFTIYAASKVDTLSLPYDYTSLMHYRGTAFARVRGTNVIQTTDPKAQHVIGQRKGMTICDVEKINKEYSCRNANAGRCTAQAISQHMGDYCSDGQPDVCAQIAQHNADRCKSDNAVKAICKKSCKLC